MEWFSLAWDTVTILLIGWLAWDLFWGTRSNKKRRAYTKMLEENNDLFSAALKQRFHIRSVVLSGAQTINILALHEKGEHTFAPLSHLCPLCPPIWDPENNRLGHTITSDSMN